MVHKQSDYKIILISAYLPPENSKWGRDATSFFSHVTNEMYRYENVDLILLAGDMNARIGKLHDYIETVDVISNREVLDYSSNIG